MKALSIAGDEDRPALGHLVFPQAAVEDELVGGGGDGGRRRGDFVKKQDALPAMAFTIREDRRNGPIDGAIDTKGDAPQITGLHLRESNVDDRGLVGEGNLPHHVRFADPGRSPEHDRRMVTGAGADELLFQDGE